MSTNLPLTYSNLVLFILFVIVLGQPEQVTLIHTAMALSGSIVMHSFFKPERYNWRRFLMQDMYSHWLPAVICLSIVNFSKIGMRQFLFAALYPLIYLSIVSYKGAHGWTYFKLSNPIKHLNDMYPGVDTRVFWLYYVILGGIFMSSKYNR
jgi:Mn2+/Fe2+ NRAMP family transporter